MYHDLYAPPQRIQWATSPDGVNWTEQGMLINPGDFGWHDMSVCDVFYNGIDDKFWMFYGGNDGTQWRHVGLAKSDDGISWNDFGAVLSVSSSGWDNHSMGGAKVLWDSDAGLYYMLYAGGNGSSTGLGLASSPDGLSFTRVQSTPVITPGGSTTFDNSGTHRINAFCKEGDQYICYYSGRNGSVWSIGKAHASDPTGPWTKDGQVLVANESWEGNSIQNASMVTINGVKTLYYQNSGYSFGIAQIEDMGEECLVPSGQQDTEGPVVQWHEARFASNGNYPGFLFQCYADDRDLGGSNISSVEYFWDVDPGVGNGIPLLPIDGSFDSEIELLQPVSSYLRFSGTQHNVMYARACDTYGNWGPLASKSLETSGSGFDPIDDDFNFKNWGIGNCIGMAWANEFYWRNSISIPHNDIPLVPPDENCPLTTNIPPLGSDLRFIISAFQWGFALEALDTRITISQGWADNSSQWIADQYVSIKDMLERGHNGIIYLLPPGIGKGHAVLAYRTAEIGDNMRAIFVYDSNYPNRCGQPRNGAIVLTKEDGEWAFNDYDGYTRFGISNFWMDLNNIGLIVGLCPVDIELYTSFNDFITKDSTSSDKFIYTETHFFGNEVDSSHKVLSLGENYPNCWKNVKVISHDTASENSIVSLLLFDGGELTILADSVVISELPIEGYWYSTLDTGSIHGFVQSGSAGLMGVPVDLYNSEGTIISSIATNDSGYYYFPTLNNGSYSIAISTPIGYQAENETQEITVRGLPHENNFALTQLDITPQQRSRGYWAHQLHKALKNKPKDYSLDDFSSFASLINTHFNQNAINPVDFYTVPQPADQSDSLKILKKLLHMRNTGEWEPFLKRLAKSQLMALMLNVVSGKVSQTHEISEDRRTVSQAITYCDMLVNDEIDPPDDNGPGHGGPWCRYIRASFILGFCNLGITVPAGMIPENVIEIAYKFCNDDNLPEGFELSQNFPNPFNPTTEISFSLPDPADVRLEIYNIMGQRVEMLAEGYYEAGDYNVLWDGSDVASGVYFYRLDAGTYSAVKKMVLVK